MCSNVDGPRSYQTKWSQSKEIQYPVTYVWSLEYDKSDNIYNQKQTHRHRERACGCQGQGRGKGWELGIADTNYYT